MGMGNTRLEEDGLSLSYLSLCHFSSFPPSSRLELPIELSSSPALPRPCEFVLFANGGKCGSTALFMYIERLRAPHVLNLHGKEHTVSASLRPT